MKLKTASPTCFFLYLGGLVGKQDKDGKIHGTGQIICFPENITEWKRQSAVRSPQGSNMKIYWEVQRKTVHLCDFGNYLNGPCCEKHCCADRERLAMTFERHTSIK